MSNKDSYEAMLAQSGCGTSGYVSDLLGSRRSAHKVNQRHVEETSGIHQYLRQKDCHALKEQIQLFHQKKEGIAYTDKEIFVGRGASALMSVQMSLIKALGYKKVYYFAPVYHTIETMAELLGLELCPVNEGVHSLDGFHFSLPEEQSFLIITDPLLGLGRSASRELIDTLIAWQERTQSLIWVDGVWQYLKWDEHDNRELSAELNPELTFRTISPVHQMATPGLRFAYQIMPARMYDAYAELYSTWHGSHCAHAYRAALALMYDLNSDEGNRHVIRQAKENYHALKEAGYIHDPYDVNTGYRTVVKLMHPDKHTGHAYRTHDIKSDHHVYVNLLLPKSHWD